MEEGEGGTDESDEELRLENSSICKTKQWEKNAEQKVAIKKKLKMNQRSCYHAREANEEIK